RKVKPTALRRLIKFLVFNAATALVYGLLFALFGPAVLQELTADGTGVLVLLLALGNFSFFLCDRAIGAVSRYYRVILRKKLKHFF
ncbi:hypothetical protein H6B10_15700, partial [Gemmiger formicilis]|uniref:hypothetical protein n=1 Tax=Gemmiger formicilis TaxID=745368 RepID=UPI001D7C9B4D|nr:hypothetical protein [Gemmiger formicilis]